jgi:UDP-N-acetylglucosamine--N-acetylmuramyl-(pentapeptide) pyrophosphoryl-undecaprenol N-acetylglucosamine transferase
MSNPTILFAGGGTGGHLYPGVAVADALRRTMPDARSSFLCTRREIDRVILEPTGYAFEPQPIVPPRTSIGGLLRFWRSWRETKDQVRQLLRANPPALVVGLGGYAAGVAVRLAAGRGIPTVILNPDVIPGRANQFLMRHATAACCQFDRTADHVAVECRPKLRTTGCPIRADIVALPERSAAVARLGLDPALLTLVVTGASLGAQTVNEAVAALLAELPLPGWQVLHLAGRDHATAVRAAYAALPAVRSTVVDFTPAMSDVWAVADLCVSRSGASSCAELTATGVPSVLMPYPYHKDMHQRANAQVLADAGAAVLVDDQRDAAANAAQLRPVLSSLTTDGDRRRTMSAAARRLGHPDAAAAVADIIAGLVAGLERVPL